MNLVQFKTNIHEFERCERDVILFILDYLTEIHSLGWGQGQKEIAACTESRFFPLFATNFMYNLMYSLLKIAVSRILAKIIAKSFCPWVGGGGFQHQHSIKKAKLREFKCRDFQGSGQVCFAKLYPSKVCMSCTNRTGYC